MIISIGDLIRIHGDNQLFLVTELGPFGIKIKHMRTGHRFVSYFNASSFQKVDKMKLTKLQYILYNLPEEKKE